MVILQVAIVLNRAVQVLACFEHLVIHETRDDASWCDEVSSTGIGHIPRTSVLTRLTAVESGFQHSAQKAFFFLNHSCVVANSNAHRAGTFPL